MNPHPADDTGLPGTVAAAARQAAEDLYQALRPAMATGRPSPQVSALWQMVKMLNAVSGGLDLTSVPEAGRPRARWEEAAYLASNIADSALTITAAGLSLQPAAGYLLNTHIEVQDTAAAYGGVIELTPPDFPDTGRTLAVTVRGDMHRTLTVAADRGPSPQPRPHTAATLLRLAHHLHRVGAVLSEVVLEPEADGVPVCGRDDDEEIACEICQRTVGADIARTIEVAKPWLRTVKVCSVTCVRAAHAGDHGD